MLGQIHGVVWLAVNEVDQWIVVNEEETPSDEPELSADDVRKAAMEVHGHFGTVHAALNSGACDAELERVGFAGAQGHAKRKGLWSAIRRFVTAAKRSKNYIASLRSSLRWSGTLVGSITAALKQEIERVPGAASAGEAIREFIEVLLNATEPAEGGQGARLEQSGKSPSGANQVT
jgi:hypothetical protein